MAGWDNGEQKEFHYMISNPSYPGSKPYLPDCSVIARHCSLHPCQHFQSNFACSRSCTTSRSGPMYPSLQLRMAQPTAYRIVSPKTTRAGSRSLWEKLHRSPSRGSEGGRGSVTDALGQAGVRAGAVGSPLIDPNQQRQDVQMALRSSCKDWRE